MPESINPALTGGRPQKSTRRDMDTAYTSTEFAHRLHWEALVDAGLIGQAPPASPEVAANRAATDALFRSFPSNRRRFG